MCKTSFFRKTARLLVFLTAAWLALPVMPCFAAKSFAETRAKAEQGDAVAQFNLGGMYVNGKGVTRDYAEAIEWYRKAAEQGDAKAQTMLGVMYAKGEGVTRNYVEAVKWSRKAAEQGQALAQFNLGILHYEGQGVPQNYVYAYMWFSLASAQGNESARKNLDITEKQLTSEQINEAQKMAAKFAPVPKQP